MPLAESLFQKMINDTHFIDNVRYFGFYYPLYKFTIELLFDRHVIPDKYFVQENRILHQYPKIYKRLGKYGDLALIEKFLKLNRDSCRGKNSDFIMTGAAKFGNIDVLKWMVQNNYLINDIVIANAAKGNQIETLEWLVGRTNRRDSIVASYAAKKGHMNILKYLIKVGYPVGYAAACHAANNGHQDMVMFLYPNYPASTVTFNIWQGAIISGNIEILKFLHSKGLDFTNKFFQCKSLHILIWLFDNYKIATGIDLAISIANDGNLECLQFLYSKGCPIFDPLVFRGAVYAKNLEMIEWLYNLGVPFNKTVTDAAIRICSAMILKLLIGWKCELCPNACELAAYYGDLEILQLFYDDGCVLCEKVIENAALYGHQHVIAWARQNGYKWNADVCHNTVLWDHIDILRFLHAENCPWDERVCLNAIEHGHVDILKFAIENGCNFSDKSYCHAIESKNENIIACVKNYLANKKL